MRWWTRAAILALGMAVLVSGAIAIITASSTGQTRGVPSANSMPIPNSGTGADAAAPGTCKWCAYYARFRKGLPSARSFFPIALWDQNAAGTNKTGGWGYSGNYSTLAKAAVGMGVNTFVDENNWPQAYASDNDPSGQGFMQAACNAGEHVLAGGDPGAIVWRGSGKIQEIMAGDGSRDARGTFTLTVDGHRTRAIPYNASAAKVSAAINAATGRRTVRAASGGPLPGAIRLTFASRPSKPSVNFSKVVDPAGIASVQAIAHRERSSSAKVRCSKFLNGYVFGDEPNECAVNTRDDVRAMNAIDPARLAYEGMAQWVTWNASAGCAAKADANFAATNIPDSDDYHDTDPWSTGGCAHAADVRTSPAADCSWVYGYQAAVQSRLAPNKPTWEEFETGNDVLFYAEQNGSSCNTRTNVCTVRGGAAHEYNATAPQVNANVWGALMNGIAGVEWFCDGSAGVGKANNTRIGGTADSNNFAYSDCLGGGRNSYSSAEFTNLQYIDHTVEAYAPELNTASDGRCTMQPSTSLTVSRPLLTKCSNGNLTLTTSSRTEPIQGMTKHYGGSEYLFVMTDRGNGKTTGTYRVAGHAGQTATLVYDSAARYDRSISQLGKTFTLSSSSVFSDSLVGDNGRGTNNYGAGANSYQVKIYKIS
jgi:hypothetical protein